MTSSVVKHQKLQKTFKGKKSENSPTAEDDGPKDPSFSTPKKLTGHEQQYDRDNPSYAEDKLIKEESSIDKKSPPLCSKNIKEDLEVQQHAPRRGHGTDEKDLTHIREESCEDSPV